MAATETPPTDAPSTDAPPADAPSSGQVFEVGMLLDRTAVLSTSDVDPWTDPNTPVYLDGEDPSKARPFTQLQTEQQGNVIVDTPKPYAPPAPGAVADQVMRDLGWDDETSQRMAQARHATDPDRYPTVEAATYTDPSGQPAADTPAEPEPAPAP